MNTSVSAAVSSLILSASLSAKGGEARRSALCIARKLPPVVGGPFGLKSHVCGAVDFVLALAAPPARTFWKAATSTGSLLYPPISRSSACWKSIDISTNPGLAVSPCLGLIVIVAADTVV